MQEPSRIAKRAKAGALVACILCFAACSKDVLEVEYPQMISPAEAYTELARLAVGLDPKFGPETQDGIMKSLKACPLFSDVSVMDKPVRVSGSNPKDYFDALIKRSPQAQASQGIMSVQIEDNSESSALEKSQAFMLADQAALDWYPSFGIAAKGTLGFPTRPELAPKWTLRKRDSYVRVDKLQYIVRFVMYNRVAGKIIHDRVVSNISTLLNYSRKPTLKKAKFDELVQKSVVDEILFYACPAKDKVARKLYYIKNPNQEGELVNEGVDLADENRWNLAATKWTNVLLKDKRNVIAHHNLGVHYERSGELFQALDHFKQARLGRLGKSLDNVFDELQLRYQPRVGGSDMYPQVAFVTGGNWAFIRNDGQPLPVDQTYSLYRYEPVINAETSRIMGLSIREVGIFKATAYVPPYNTGRIKEYLADYPVRPGDFLITE